MSHTSRQSYEDLLQEGKELRAQLEEAQEVLTAIRTGSVDALIVEGPTGEKVYTLQGADFAYRLFVEHMNEGAVTIDKDGLILSANQLFADLVGVPLEQTAGKEFPHFLSAANQPQWNMVIGEAERGASRKELDLVNASGELVPALLSVRPLPVEPGQVTGQVYCCIVSDLRQERLYKQLQNSEARFRTVAEAVPSFLFETDAAGRNTWTSGGWCQFTGQTPAQVSGDGWAEALHPADRANSHGHWLHCIENEMPFESKQRLRRADGTYAWVLARALPVRDDNDKVTRWVGSVTDVDAIVRAEEEQSRLAAIVGSTSDAIVAKDLDGIITSWNPGAKALLGYNADEIIGRHVTVLFPPEREEEEQIIMDRLRAGESIRNYETVRRCKDGHDIWVSLTLSPIRGRQGDVLGASKIMRDISERKRAEVALEERNHQLEQLFRVSQRLVLGGTAEGEFLAPIFWDITRLINMEMFYHYSPSEEPGVLRLQTSGGITEKERTQFATMRFGDLLCGRVAEWRQQIIVEDLQQSSHPGSDILRAAGVASYAGFPLIANRELVGTIAFVSTKCTHFRENDVQLIRTVCNQIATALQRDRLHRELQAGEEQLRLALEGANLGTWDCDLRTGVSVSNRRHTEMYGFEGLIPGSLESWGERVHPDDLKQVLQTIDRARIDHGPIAVDHRLKSADAGEERWLSLYGRFSYDVSGQPIRISGVSLDITERKQAESQLCEAQLRLQQWNVELERAVQEKTAELQQSQARLRAMATELNLTEQRERKRLATDLHDYLQQMLIAGKLTVGQAKRVKCGVRACDTVLEKVDGILSEALTYSRTLVAELCPPVLRDHGLADGLSWLADYMNKHHDLTVTVVGDDDEDLVLPDDETIVLFQSTRELLINAAKHAGTGRAIVTLEARSDQLCITVHDDGKGFDLTAAGTPNEGISSQFGLFNVQERMNALGGSFTIHSAPGQGTTATMVLPLPGRTQDNLALAQSIHTEPGSETPLNDGDRSTKRRRIVPVLLVDDHAMVRQGLRSVLDAYADVHVVGEARDGIEALCLVEQYRPDVVVIDINMPKMNGIEATKSIKRRYPDTVVIGISVNVDDSNSTAMQQAGATTLLTKEAAVTSPRKTTAL